MEEIVIGGEPRDLVRCNICSVVSLLLCSVWQRHGESSGIRSIRRLQAYHGIPHECKLKYCGRSIIQQC